MPKPKIPYFCLHCISPSVKTISVSCWTEDCLSSAVTWRGCPALLFLWKVRLCLCEEMVGRGKNCYKDGVERERERERAVIVRSGNTNYSLTLTNPFISNDWNKSSRLIQHFNSTNNLQSDNPALNTQRSLHWINVDNTEIQKLSQFNPLNREKPCHHIIPLLRWR